jgi:hypothetical protein
MDENKTEIPNIKFTKLHNLAAKYKDSSKQEINKKLQNLKMNINLNSNRSANNISNNSNSIVAENAVPSLNYIDNFNKDLTNSKFSEYKKSYMTKINYHKFIFLKTSSIINILYLLDSETIASLFHVNKTLKRIILEIFKQFATLIIIKFREYYSSHLKLDKCLLTFQILSREDFMNYLKINLVVKSQVINKNLKENTVTIGFNSKFYCDKEAFKNIYIFDVRDNGPLSFWIMKEYSRVSIYVILVSQ